MIQISNKKMEYEDFLDFYYQRPDLKDVVAVIECTLLLHKFDDLTRCNIAASKLNTFFQGDVLNAVTFQCNRPDDPNEVKGSFTASLPISERNFNIFIDLLVLNLKAAETIKFDDNMIIRTETEKFIIHQKNVLKQMDKRT